MAVDLLLPLKQSSDAKWVECVSSNFDEFLIDHAANERKASSMALSMVAHYPDRKELVTEMVDLAVEELAHYRQVMQLIQARDITITGDEKDPYVNALRTHIREGPEAYFLDRLLCASVIEARGAERFALLGAHLEVESLKRFYQSLAQSESGHYTLFLNPVSYTHLTLPTNREV